MLQGSSGRTPSPATGPCAWKPARNRNPFFLTPGACGFVHQAISYAGRRPKPSQTRSRAARTALSKPLSTRRGRLLLRYILAASLPVGVSDEFVPRA